MQLEKYTNRIDIFKALIYDEKSDAINMPIFNSLLSDFYEDFVEFYEGIKDRMENINIISCDIHEDEIKFDVLYKN